MSFGQFAATSQFFLYGKRHCTRTGWERHQQSYEQPDVLTDDNLDLSGRVFVVTGANSGVGKEIASFLASRKGTVYMVCRSAARAEAARQEILAAFNNANVHVILADLGLEADVRRCWEEFVEHRQEVGGPIRLDALVCNAGVLLNEKTLTADGNEVTFATHLLMGTYLLGCLAMPALKATPDARLIAVSSGGMYNTAFPEWSAATSTGNASYSGNLAYAYAKRGQVLLMERWAEEHPEVTFVSSHPGWTDTPAVDEAYGSQKKFLEPLRTTWQGAEGIIWLCVVEGSKLESGAFYLDRETQVKHMAGAFFGEGRFTKNTSSEVDEMVRRLGDLAHEVTPSVSSNVGVATLQSGSLVAMQERIDLQRFMGRWYVIANIPTFADRGSINNTEDYAWDTEKQRVKITFGYSKTGQPQKRSELLQRAIVANDAGTRWNLSAKLGVYIPIGIPYLIIHCADDYSSAIIGVPDRRYLWIMSRQPVIDEATLNMLLEKACACGYERKNIVRVPQTWE